MPTEAPCRRRGSSRVSELVATLMQTETAPESAVAQHHDIDSTILRFNPDKCWDLSLHLWGWYVRGLVFKLLPTAWRAGHSFFFVWKAKTRTMPPAEAIKKPIKFYKCWKLSFMCKELPKILSSNPHQSAWKGSSCLESELKEALCHRSLRWDQPMLALWSLLFRFALKPQFPWTVSTAAVHRRGGNSVAKAGITVTILFLI